MQTLVKYAGKDGSKAFHALPHSVAASKILKAYQLGKFEGKIFHRICQRVLTFSPFEVDISPRFVCSSKSLTVAIISDVLRSGGFLVV